ncbi:S-layer homology domain-containing protein [bacterium LRH843]|nr:S-layer homology domain-containing protein [bacterium LRH843]
MKRQKLAISFMLAMLITVSAFLHPAHAASFEDTLPAWTIVAVDYLVEKGAVQGYLDGTFKPSSSITRAEAASILAISLDLTIDESKKTNFADAKDHWATAAIAALQAHRPGVVNGYGDGSFKPNNTITRQEMAKMIVEAYDLLLDVERTIIFKDNTSWGREYVNILASLGIVEGVGEAVFDPNGSVTRGQAAVFIHRTEIPYIFRPVLVESSLTSTRVK